MIYVAYQIRDGGTQPAILAPRTLKDAIIELELFIKVRTQDRFWLEVWG